MPSVTHVPPVVTEQYAEPAVIVHIGGDEDAGGDGEGGGGETAGGGETDEHVPQRTGQLVAMVALKL